MSDRYEFGPDVITLYPAHPGEVGAGSIRSGFAFRVNGIARGYLYFPSGWGGRWTAKSLNGSGWGSLRRRQNIVATEAAEPGRVQVLRQVLEHLHEWFPTEIETVMAAAADRERGLSRKLKPPEYRYSAEPVFTSEYARDIWKDRREGERRIAERVDAEEHLEAMLSIDGVAGLSNRQAVAIKQAADMAAAQVERLHDCAGAARRRKEQAHVRQLMREGRGTKPWDLPDWWPLVEENGW